ncbi:unnamed protein product [Somion occarium]|uniref:Uncharacterized protein n=1 Tax=Somion occarium TaxID=3059160 RepID=A0ABP1E2J2_9APHY
MFSRLVLLFFLALSAVLIDAAPVQADKRQIGNLQCNVDRVKIVSDIAGAKSTVNTLATQLASDPAGSDSISQVSDGIANAQDGISQIAKSLFTGQQAPADARQQVEDGLTTATTALANITSTDPDVTSNLTKAQGQLQKAATAGEGVLANCK